MAFEWDPKKSLSNIEKHGISFEQAITLFLVNHVTAELNTSPEARWAIIGQLNGKFFTGIYTYRGKDIRLISVRRSRRNEEKFYGANFT